MKTKEIWLVEYEMKSLLSSLQTHWGKVKLASPLLLLIYCLDNLIWLHVAAAGTRLHKVFQLQLQRPHHGPLILLSAIFSLSRPSRR